MARLERICRILRDLGMFFLGVAAIIAAIDYFFIHPDPMRDSQHSVNKSMIEAMEGRLKQPDTSKRSDNRSDAPPFKISPGQ
jgi:hypothetical protein